MGTIFDKVLSNEELMEFLSNKYVTETTTVGDVLDAINAEGLLEKYRDVQLGKDIYVGNIIDMVLNSKSVQAYKNESYTYKITVGEMIDKIGEDWVKDILQNRIAEASYNANYKHTKKNVSKNWLNLAVFVLAFAALSTITLEFIDKDKR